MLRVEEGDVIFKPADWDAHCKYIEWLQDLASEGRDGSSDFMFMMEEEADQDSGRFGVLMKL